MRQKTARQQFTPFFSEKTKQEQFAPGRGSGHHFWCPDCQQFRVHAMEMVGNGTPILRSTCRNCGSSEKFIRAAGQWVPESVTEILDAFVGQQVSRKAEKMWKEAEIVGEETVEADAPEEKDEVIRLTVWDRIKRKAKPEARPEPDADVEWDVDLDAPPEAAPGEAEPADGYAGDGYTGSRAWQTARGGLDLRTRGERLRAWMTCGRYLRFVAVPVSAPLILIGGLGALSYVGVYVHPVYEWIAPYWQPWMNTPLLTAGPLIGAAALFVGYARCLLARRGISGIAEEMEQSESSILEEMDEFAREAETLEGIDEL